MVRQSARWLAVGQAEADWFDPPLERSGEPLLLTMTAAAKLCGVGPSRFRSWRDAGLLDRIMFDCGDGGRVLYIRRRLIDWLAGGGPNPQPVHPVTVDDVLGTLKAAAELMVGATQALAAIDPSLVAKLGDVIPANLASPSGELHT